MQPFTVEGTQVWIQQGATWRIALTQRGDLAASPTFPLARAGETQYRIFILRPKRLKRKSAPRSPAPRKTTSA